MFMQTKTYIKEKEYKKPKEEKKKHNDSNTKERSIKVLHQIQPQKTEKKK